MHTDITWTDSAWERFQAVRADCYRIGDYYGVDLQQAHLAEFLERFTQVTLAAGPCNVQTDGDGFLISTPHIVIGLVWTPDSDETLLLRLKPEWRNETIRDDWPRTGRWSAHS